MSDADSIRVSDAEREAVADRLRQSAAEGRLDTDELGDRVQSALSARTRAELATLTADLPASAPVSGAAVPARRDEHLRARIASFISINGVCVAVWLASGAHGSFWPAWVMLGTGIGLFSSLVNRALGVDEHRHGRHRHRDRHRRGLPAPPPLPPLPGSPPPRSDER